MPRPAKPFAPCSKAWRGCNADSPRTWHPVSTSSTSIVAPKAGSPGCYASAACLAAAASLGRTRFWLSALFAAGFAIWSLTLLPNLRVAESAAFTSFRMQSPSHEESREAAGLLLCATYAAWLAAVCYRRERLNVP